MGKPEMERSSAFDKMRLNKFPLDSTNSEKGSKETYERFTQALEKHGTCKKNAWDSISIEMGWSSKEVKEYAFQYMLKLHTLTSQNGNDGNVMIEIDAAQTCFTPDHLKVEEVESKDWTFEECILFDNLMARYFNENNNTHALVEKFSSLIPSKSEIEIW